MKYRPRPGSSLPYIAIAIASVIFAALQPSFSADPEYHAVALADLSWIGDGPTQAR